MTRPRRRAVDISGRLASRGITPPRRLKGKMCQTMLVLSFLQKVRQTVSLSELALGPQTSMCSAVQQLAML